MPRVTDSHRAGRRAEILTAAARLFADNGFHATSMAGIIAASGLSAGAVYTYFRSKEELIGAVAELVGATADEVFGELLADGATPSPAAVVTTMVEQVTERFINDSVIGVDMSRLAVQVWAEALRSPEVHARAGRVLAGLRAHCAEAARRWQAAGNLPADAVPDQVGAAMLSLVQGYVLQRLLLPVTGAPYYVAGLQALLASSAPALSSSSPPVPPSASGSSSAPVLGSAPASSSIPASGSASCSASASGAT